MTVQVKHKKLILAAVILALIAITAAVIKFMPKKDMPADTAPLLKTERALTVQKPVAGKARAVKAPRKNAAVDEPAEASPEEDIQEKEVEQAEPLMNDTPEKAQIRATLTNEIKTLSQEREKEVREFSALIRSFDEAITNSQLPPDELQKKKLEIEAVKQMMMSAHNSKVSSMDSALREKVLKYREATDSGQKQMQK